VVNGASIASPVSTGGGGSDFERKVGAAYLSSALLRSACRGFSSGSVTEVRFQRRFEGESADDIKVICELAGGEAKLTLQVKRDLSFGEKDPVFDEVLAALWETFNDPTFKRESDRFGIAIALEAKRLSDFQAALAWARTSTDSTDFFARINHPGLSNKNQRYFTELLKRKLTSISGRPVDDGTVWAFMARLELLTFDFEAGGSRDELFAISSLRYRLSPDRADRATGLFAKLVDYAAEGHRTAGSYNEATLAAALALTGETLAPPQDCREDLGRLAEHGRFILQRVNSDIGGCHLSRQAIRTDLEAALVSSSLFIVGPPGVGKSALLRGLVESALESAGAVVFAGDRICGRSWDGFAATLQLKRPLRDILGAVELGTSKPLLVVDGIDRAEGVEAQEALNDLLREVRSRNAARPWTLIFTCREGNVATVSNWLCPEAVVGLELRTVSGLSDSDLALVAEQVPRLAALIRAGDLQDVLRIPFFLRQLADPRVLGSSGPGRVATENDIARIWWERIVGPDRARQQLLLGLGGRLLSSPGHEVLLQYLAADAVAALEADGVLVREADRDAYRFSHDLLEDWVYLRLVRQSEANLAGFLHAQNEPLALQRSFHLFGAALLEEEEDSARWATALHTIEDDTTLLPRWRQALLTAPFASTRGAELLARAAQTLLLDDATRLCDLLRALRTIAVYPNLQMLPVAAALAESAEEALSLLYTQMLPRLSVWTILLPWLVDEARAFPRAMRGELIECFALWQVRAPSGSPHRAAIALLADEWLREMEEPPPRTGGSNA
jgi:hypothetical protein